MDTSTRRTKARFNLTEDIPSMKGHLQFISGPISWTYFKLGAQHFHFFGDLHGSKGENCESVQIQCSTVKNPKSSESCYDITYLLEDIFKNAEKKNQTVDFFIEIPYIGSIDKDIEYHGTYDVDYINDIQSYFTDYFTFQKKKKFPNVRLHYSDIRRSLDMPGYLKATYIASYIVMNVIIEINDQEKFEFLNILMNRLFGKEKFMKQIFEAHFKDGYEDILDEIFEKLLTDQEKNQFDIPFFQLQFVIEEMKKQTKQRDQVSKHLIKIQLDELRKDKVMINGKNMADLILKFIFQRFNEIDVEFTLQEWKKFYTQHRSNPQNITPNQYYQLRSQFASFVDLDSLLMDAYTLARMFRTYGESNKPSDLVITYTGDEHTANYVYFFEEILGLNSSAKKGGLKKAKRCIYDEDFSKYFQ